MAQITINWQIIFYFEMACNDLLYQITQEKLLQVCLAMDFSHFVSASAKCPIDESDLGIEECPPFDLAVS